MHIYETSFVHRVWKIRIEFFAVLAISMIMAATGASSHESPVYDPGRRATQSQSMATAATGPGARKPWYMALHIGGVITPEMRFAAGGNRINAPLNAGVAIGGALGYKFGFGLRLESEVTYRYAEANSVETVGVSIIRDASGGVEAANVMLNGWYDFDFLSVFLGEWVPYVGGGAGYGKFWVDPGGWVPGSCSCSPPEPVAVIEASDSGYLWQAGGGLIYKYSDTVQLSVDYRFLRPFGHLVFDDPSYPAPFETNYESHSVFFGLRGFF